MDLERLRRRMERLRAHHNKCEASALKAVEEEKSAKVKVLHPPRPHRDKEEEEEQREKESQMKDPLQVLMLVCCTDGVSPPKQPSPQIKRKRRAVYDFSPQISSDHCSDDQASEVEDQTHEVSMTKPSPQIKKKRVAKGKANVVKTTTITKRPWRDKERRAVSKHLSSFIAQRRVPGKAACMKCLTEETALRERTWTDITHYIAALFGISQAASW
ncbi:uncharacterized protein LOC130238134 [Danio aesculapii]|uniref:uncharacterized protein LOC130238134 n=1 Tax=Danio aesculapii TaxID=1142201 RepID=UPI0024C0AC69|nr:uncharacterized protein LOC130238134 [Danio aesculapii]